MVPDVVAVAAMVTLVAALEIQIRLVVEPSLLGVHSEQLASYAARVGPSFPGLRPPDPGGSD